MSYALAFTKRAKREFLALDPWLQEETLDEIERLAANPKLIRPRKTGIAIEDFIRVRGGQRHYVFLTVAPRKLEQVLRIVTIGTCRGTA